VSKALCVAAFGARGTGKTAFVVQWLTRHGGPRVLIWDFKDDPTLRELGQPVHSLAELARLAKAKTFRLRYVVDHSKDLAKQFDDFCLVAWTASRLTMAVCELPEVTKAHKAPVLWRRCVNVGREYTAPGGAYGQGFLSIVVDAQRSAEVDKSLIGNADILHVGRMTNPSDAREMADFLGVPHTEIMRLPDLHWIERRAGTIDPIRGVLTFPKSGKPRQLEPGSEKNSLPAAPRKRAYRQGA
jgi:hypothetical protein